MGNCLTGTRTAHVKPARVPTADKVRRRIKLQDLPEDLLCGILSKLPTEEVVRTSVLSSEWRCLWTGIPKLSFNGRVMCRRGEEQDTQMFIHCVNAVLRQHNGRGVEALELKCILKNKLVDHLNNWVNFAVSSRTKNLALRLAPLSRFMECADLYVLPSELFDKESASCLRCLQVSYVCLKPPSQFLGFSNLRKLELCVFNTTRKDLEDIVCSCCNLEWLSIVKCYLQDELTMVRPLSHLQYLRIVQCNILTKIEFHAANLSTFVYDGPCIPIALHHASKLENAKVRFSGACFQQAVTTVLLNGIPDVQRLTLEFAAELGKFEVFPGFWCPHSEPFRHEVLPCQYKHMKSMYVSGFRGGRGQVEFVTHVVENAPAIEDVTIDTARHHNAFCPEEINPADRDAALDVVRGPLLERLPPHAKLLLR